MFQETEHLKNFLYFRNSCFRKWNFLAPSLKNFLYFGRELAKPENPENQKFLTFLLTFFEKIF